MKILRTDPDLFGIRARLLTLLLPAILGLLALDSWNDYRALKTLVQETHDHTMLETANTLRSSLSAAPDGSFRLNEFAVQTLSAADNNRHLHVGLKPATPHGGGAGPVTLFGESDLPAPQAFAATADATPSTAPVWYNDFYRSHPVRVVALQGLVTDSRGLPFKLLIQVAENTDARDQAQDASMRQALIRDARVALVLVLLVWLGVTWSLRPLERLRKSILQNTGQALQPLDTRDVPHEVAPLVDAVNQHVASYRELLDRQSQFLADASHQLRTPLAIMLTQAGVALREKDPEQLRGTLRAIVVQITRSRRLCEQLLSLAHANDSGTPADAPEPVDLNTVARDVVLQYLALAHEKNQDLGWVDARDAADEGIPSIMQEDAAPSRPVLTRHAAVPVLANGPELHEALSNLVHNAIVYTPVAGRITVTAAIRDGMAIAEVSDDGPGIAEALRDGVFERFHHAGPGSTEGRYGAGLGLAIARAYARRNGGDISLEDTGVSAAGAVATGLRAVMRLPLATATAA